MYFVFSTIIDFFKLIANAVNDILFKPISLLLTNWMPNWLQQSLIDLGILPQTGTTILVFLGGVISIIIIAEIVKDLIA